MTVTATDRRGFDDLGTGDPALLCLPGWCGDRTAFDPLLPRLARHRRVLSMDLRDHGGGPPARQDFGYREVVDDAVALLDTAGVTRVVPVALSHAGWVAIELRRRLGPERVPAIVLLDWMVLGAPPGFGDALAGLQDESSWQQVRADLFAMWTTNLDAPALRRYVEAMGGYGFAHWRRAGREIATAFGRHGSPLAALEQLPAACPTLHLYAQPADDAVLGAQQAFGEAHPWFQVRRLDARSHFPMFEVPGEIETLVEGFLRTVPC